MKIKIIAIITVIMLLLISVPVYADTPIPDPPSDGMQYWVILSHPLYDFWCLSSNNPITVKKGGQYWIVADGYRDYKYDNNKWVFKDQGSDRREFGIASAEIYQANHDIEYEDGSGFFFLRPRVSPLSQGMKATDFGTILRTFSAGLIPLLGLLILAISCKKAWEFLRGQLAN